MPAEMVTENRFKNNDQSLNFNERESSFGHIWTPSELDVHLSVISIIEDWLLVDLNIE